MGCDGGTIPKRSEVVKTKKQSTSKDKRELELMNKWGFCAASGDSLHTANPIVASQMGDLMSKEGALQHVLDTMQDSMKSYYVKEDNPGLNSVHTTKDIKELKLKRLTDEEIKSRQESNREVFWADFVCPITNLEMNGKYKFVFSWRCGCVVSERAIIEVPNDKKCLVCQKPYREFDLVYINPESKKDIEANQARFLVRKLSKDKDFKALKRSAATSTSSNSSSKRNNSGHVVNQGASGSSSRAPVNEIDYSDTSDSSSGSQPDQGEPGPSSIANKRHKK